MSPGRAERVHARRGEGEVDAAVDLVVGAPAARTTSRPSAPPWRRSPATASASGRPSAQGRRAAALITMTPTSRSAHSGEELLGRLAVLGPGPQRGVDREHHGVEVEAAQRLEVGARHLEVVPGDAGEAGVAGVAQREDPLERGRAPVELRERGHGVGLVEVEHLGVEQAPGRVELVAARRRGWPAASCRR